MKKVLIISPYFPPSNAADMQRIRMSLPYFEQFGWEAEIVTVDPKYSDLQKDDLLMESIHEGLKIHTIKALDKKWTSKTGLGSIALRSLWFYFRRVNQILKSRNLDLIYFSTTQFPVCILGAYWKKRFKIPYVIDMQDPWHTDYYLNKPKNERPAKYWFSYRLNKWIEPIAIKNTDGLISVAAQYIMDLESRYPVIKPIPKQTIPFAFSEIDFRIAKASRLPITFQTGQCSIVYAGVAGHQMQQSIRCLFQALQQLKEQHVELYDRTAFYFIGTSYALQGKGGEIISKTAAEYEISNQVIEYKARIGFYATLKLIAQADALLIIGTDDPGYTASKLYPYIFAKKPLLAILHPKSSAAKILKSCKGGTLITTDMPAEVASKIIIEYLTAVNLGKYEIRTDWKVFRQYSAEEMTQRQCLLFNEVLNK